MVLLQGLFLLSTSPTQPAEDLRTLANRAILSVASVNPQLFMTTLAFDVLHTRSTEQRMATMKLVAFMVRKKPVVLFPSLAKLAEAVVRSLDPV